jgi:uncharacterized protein (DUF2062 family)
LDVKKFLKSTYQKIIKINDSPHRIAGGFAIGIFFGVLPGAGVMAAILFAYIFRVNRAAAFASSLLTNSWLGIVTFVMAVQIGGWVTGTEWHQLYDKCRDFIKHFEWEKIVDGSALPILKPLMAGYAIIGAAVAVLVYICVFMIVVRVRNRRKAAGLTSDSKD